MAVVGSLIVLLSANNTALTAGLLGAEKQLKSFGTTAGTTGAQAGAILGGVGLVVAAGAALAIKTAGDYEDAFAGVKKTVDETQLAAAGLTFDDLSRQFRSMALEIPIAATELAAIGETAGALGIRATDIDDFTRTVALLGATTDLSTDAAAEALGKVGTILGLSGSEFEAFGDILVNLGNKGASTESEIIEITKRFAAAGQSVGLSTPQILAFSSAMASAGVEPEAAGTALSKLFGNMVKETANGSKAGKAFAAVTGKSFADFSKLVRTDTVGAMTLFLESLQGLDKFELAQALDSVGIKGQNVTNAIKLLAQTYETNLIPAFVTAETASGALPTEASKKFDTFNAKVTLLGNSVTELGIRLGTALLPAATQFVTDISNALNGLDGTVQRINAAYNKLPQGLRDLLEKPIDIEPIAPNLVEPQAPGLGVKPGLTDTLGMALGLIPKDAFNQSPWGTFNTPGFRAGQAGSPYLGPPTPSSINAQTGFVVNRYTTVNIGGDKVGEFIDREIYNRASTYSSGFSNDRGPTVR